MSVSPTARARERAPGTRGHAAPGRMVAAPTLERAVAQARARDRRVVGMDVAGQRFWVKFARGKRWAVQVSKGDPRRALAQEVALLRAMGARGAPVAELVAVGTDHYVTRDAGPTLAAMLATAADDPALPDRLAAAGRALAALHRLGMAHGRPYLRDLCWQEATREVSFIDVERGARLEAGPRRRARDVALLVMSIFALVPDARGATLADAFLAAYFAAAPPGMRAACAGFARRWRWLAVVTAPLRWHEARFRPNRRWKEYTAVPLTLARLRRG